MISTKKESLRPRTTVYAVDRLTGDLAELKCRSQYDALIAWIWVVTSPDNVDYEAISLQRFNKLKKLTAQSYKFGVELMYGKRRLGNAEFYSLIQWEI